MGVYIKNWSLADWKELLKWAKIGANNAMIGEYAEVEELPPHGRLIDADALEEDGADVHEDIVCCGYVEASIWGFSYELIKNAPTVIEAEEVE